MLVRHTILYLPAQVLAPAIQLATILVWAHILPPDAVALATMTVAVQEITFSLFYAWWSHFMLRMRSRFDATSDLGALLSTEPLAVALAATLQLLVVPLGLALYFSEVAGGWQVAVMTAYVLTRSLNVYVAERARATARIGLYTLVQIGGPGLGLVIGVLVVLSGTPTSAAVLGGLAIAQTFLLASAWLLRSPAPAKAPARPKILREAAAFGLPVATALLMSSVSVNAPRFIVDQTAGLTAAGIFAVAYGLGLRCASVASMLVTAGAYPLVVRRMETEGVEVAYAQHRTNVLLLAAVVLPAALGLIAVSRSLVLIVLPGEFQSAAAVVLPLAAFAGALQNFRAHTTDQVFYLRARTRLAARVALIELVLSVGLSWAGAVALGLPGAVAGLALAAAAGLATSGTLARRRLDFRFPFVGAVPIATAAAVMALLVWLMPVTANPLVLAGEVVVGALIYAAMLGLFFPRLVREQLAALRAWVARDPVALGDELR